MIKNFNEFINENAHSNNLNEDFYKWFGSSKIVDMDGEPLVCYHGTDTHFESFNVEKMRSGWLSKGFYFTENEAEARDFGSILMQVYLRIENPFVIESDKISDNGLVEFSKSTKEQIIDKYPEVKSMDWKNVSEFLMSKGYDGIMNSNNLIVAFRPNQIKSIDNDGSWSLGNDNIYK